MPDVLRLMGGSKALIEKGVGYTRIMLGVTLPLAVVFVIYALLSVMLFRRGRWKTVQV